MFFYLEWSESAIHADILQPIQKYIIEETFDTTFTLDEMESTYKEPAERLMKFDFNSIGSHQAIGDKIRLTYRIYNTKENTEETTKAVFPNYKTSNHPLRSYAEKAEPVDIQLVKDLLGVLIEDPPEYKEP